MKASHRFLVVLTVLLTAGLLALGGKSLMQTRPNEAADAPSQPASPVALPEAPSDTAALREKLDREVFSKLSSEKFITRKYDKVSGSTTLSLAEKIVLPPAETILHAFTSDKSAQFSLQFIRAGKQWQWLSNPDTTFLVDGERWNLKGDLRKAMVESDVVEEEIYLLSAGQMAKLVTASQVEIKIGRSEFELSRDSRDKLGGLAYAKWVAPKAANSK